MEVEDVAWCSIHNWFPIYEKNSIKTKLIPLPKEVVDYLRADSIVLPGASPAEEDSDEDDSWSDEGEEASESVSFPETEAAIEEAIAKLGGAVFPKLNWSSPKDAAWIALNQTLKCETVREVFLLLKSSDYVTHDLDKAFTEGCDPAPPKDDPRLEAWPWHIALRKWSQLVPSMEFRCFVCNSTLVGACQRDHTNFYSFLVEKQAEYAAALCEFWNEVIRPKCGRPTVCFDAYIDRKGKVYLIDFNPAGPTTNPLLFEWREVLVGDAYQHAKLAATENEGRATVQGITMRVIEEQGNIRPTSDMLNRLPMDFYAGEGLQETMQRAAEELGVGPGPQKEPPAPVCPPCD